MKRYWSSGAKCWSQSAPLSIAFVRIPTPADIPTLKITGFPRFLANPLGNLNKRNEKLSTNRKISKKRLGKHTMPL
ncbi:hypothetical protein PsAD2_00225 [Pseudovibrio axinellae]|uniref:Uncharacterized protein n=1 Tax=Pseudovibrio axinellae TaxID=989403 RepID=A0A166B0Z4_9HYPH|nr:hypothetical protein PsAD2_00225 [Pseudovibrio axinellae]SEQ79089.1 hypothetical protein SAMN05421798_104219 [Pseudovibrio axinellae]